MRLVRLDIANFRCLKEASTTFTDFTSIVGRNGTGKSSMLHALEYLFGLDASVAENDFYSRDQDLDISITAHFDQLLPDEIADFGRDAASGSFSIKKVFTKGEPSGRYYSLGQQVPEFVDVRDAGGRAQILERYRALASSFGLPSVRNSDEALRQLEVYEEAHPDGCRLLPRRVQFGGPRNIGGGRLDNHTSFIFVPAVKHLHEETDSRSGSIARLINEFVRAAVEMRPDIQEFKQRFSDEATRIYSDENLTELPALADGITAVLQDYAPGAELKLRWGEAKLPEIQLPEVIKRVLDDGFEASIGHVGHGLQRAIVISLLQYIEMVLGQQSAGEGRQRKILLAIEEPELYQHPSRCRYLNQLLRRLAATERLQVIAVTHSPFFVSILHARDIRVACKRETDPALPKHTEVVALDGERAVGRLAAALDRDDLTVDAFFAFADPIMKISVNEGFFSEKVLLVEGETEIGAFAAVADQLNLELEKRGVSIVSVEGKSKLDKPYLIFSGLGVKAHVVADADNAKSDDHKKQNVALQRLCGAPEVEKPKDFSTATLTMFEANIETYLRSCTNALHEDLVHASTAKVGYPNGIESPLKKASVAYEYVAESVRRGAEFPLLERALRSLLAL